MRTGVLLFLACLVAIGVAAPAAPESRKTFIECESIPGDKLLFVRRVQVGGTIFVVKQKSIFYPEDGPGGETIHCIKAVDLKSKNGGHVIIEAGGVGHKFVIMTMESDRGSGFKYDVEIYGQVMPQGNKTVVN